MVLQKILSMTDFMISHITPSVAVAAKSPSYDYSFLTCDAVQFGKEASKFQMNMVPSFTQNPKISGNSFL